MIYGAILAILLGGLAYIQYLKNKLEQHQQELAVVKSKQKEAEWDQKIDASKLRITEEEKDYNNAENDFKNKYGNGDSNSTSKPK